MASNYSDLLGLVLPVQGELAGTWGDTVNNFLTRYLDASIAGTQTISTDVDVTLTKTEGAPLSATSSQYSTLRFTGARTAIRNVTVPATSKFYIVQNATTGGFGVRVRGTGPTTGIVVEPGEFAVLSWTGTDFARVSTGGPGSFTSLSASGAVTLNSGTANGVLFLNGSKVVSSGSALTFDGTTFASNGNTTLGDEGTDTTTLNSQLSANGTVGTSGQVLSSRGANLSPQWQTLQIAARQILDGEYLSEFVTTSSTTFTVPAGVSKVRGYAVGAGSSATTAVSGAGGGMQFGTLSVAPGDVLTITISAGTAQVIRAGTVLLQGNPASGTTGGAAGTLNAAVLQGGAFSGGAGVSGNGAGGGSAASPLGNGFPGGASPSGGGGGIGGKGGDGVSGESGGGGGAGGAGANGNSLFPAHGGGAGGAAGAKPGPGRSIPYADPLLRRCVSAGGGGTRTGGTTGHNGGPGGGGGGATTSAGSTGDSPGGYGGFGGGGGGSTNGNNRGGDGGDLGGGGGATNGVGGSAGIGGGGGSGNGTGSGGPAGVWIFY